MLLFLIFVYVWNQLEQLDQALLQQKPSANAVATLEKVIEIQSKLEGARQRVLNKNSFALKDVPVRSFMHIHKNECDQRLLVGIWRGLY